MPGATRGRRLTPWGGGDAESFAWTTPFEVVVSFETIEHLKDPAAFVRRVGDLLEPGGWFLMSVPLGYTAHLDPYHLHAFEEEDVLTMLTGAGFTVDHHHRDELFARRRDLRNLRLHYPEAPQRRSESCSRGRERG